jgi:hypothetical protein
LVAKNYIRLLPNELAKQVLFFKCFLLLFENLCFCAFF